MAAVYAVPIAIGVAVPTVKRWRNQRRRRQLSEWARDRGLVEDELGDMRGTLHEQRLELEYDRNQDLVATVLIRPALDMSLLVQPASWPAPYQRSLIRTSDPTFERHFLAFGADELRVRELLDVEIRHQLVALGRLARLRLMDDRIALWISASGLDGETVDGLVRQAGQLLGSIERRRPHLPASRALAPYLPAWSAFAEEHGLQLSRAPLGLRGTFRGRDVWAVAVASGVPKQSTYATHLLDVLCWFEPALGLGVHVKSAGLAALRAGHGGKTRAFGDVFSFSLKDERAGQLLDHGLQRELLRLQRERGAITLTDNWLWVRQPQLPAQPAEALEAMEEVSELAHVITQRARPLTTSAQGPYRGRQ